MLKATDNRVGYMHINAMGSGGIGEFDKFWRAFRNLDGIIIDVRRNSGGWTEYFLIDKLERQQVGFNVLRGMKPFRYPGSVGPQCYVAVSNEDNGSDGEAFIQHFQDRQLGPVVGTPSWGGLVGIINGQPTDRQRQRPAAQQRLLRQSGTMVGGEQGRHPRHSHRQRSGLGHGRARPAAGQGDRDHPGSDREKRQEQVPAAAGLPGQEVGLNDLD